MSIVNGDNKGNKVTDVRLSIEEIEKIMHSSAENLTIEVMENYCLISNENGLTVVFPNNGAKIPLDEMIDKEVYYNGHLNGCYSNEDFETLDDIIEKKGKEAKEKNNKIVGLFKDIIKTGNEQR